jgi:hypothetical protein
MLEYERRCGRGAVIAAKARILVLAEALDVSVARVRHDECGDPRIVGRDGHIYADGSAGFLIACHPGRDTAHRWMNVKRRLRFCHVTQDGDDEGCLRLDHLPDQREAEEIRAAIHVRRKMHISATQRVALERGRASLQRR